jgi:transcriptional regulator with XRE-family HTH domain
MTIDTISFTSVRESILSNPEVSSEYEALKSEFEFARAVLEMRESLGLTQRQFADLTGIKQSQLARLESGKQMPRIDTLANLAERLGLVVEVRFVNPTTGKSSRKVKPILVSSHQKSNPLVTALTPSYCKS